MKEVFSKVNKLQWSEGVSGIN